MFQRPVGGDADLPPSFDTLPADISGAELQNIVTETGKANGYTKETLRSWYQALYQVLLGSDEGPRFGPFIELYGIEPTRRLIATSLARG